MRRCNIEIGFINGSHLHLRGKRLQDFVDFFGTLTVALGMAVDKNCMRAKLRGCAQRKRRMDSKFAGFIRCGGNHSALVALTADNDGFSFEGGVVEFFHGNKKSVHIDVEDGAGKSRDVRSRGHERIVAAPRAARAASSRGDEDCR